jgi:CelD/BcsL family acetyltransferase involved in cellulose biosynthesis
MTLTASIADLDDDWSTFVLSRPEAVAFHHPAWARAIADTYGYRPFGIAVRNGQGRLLAALPVIEVRHRPLPASWVSLPYSDHCPLLRDPSVADAEVIAALDVLRRAEGVGRLEIRDGLHGVPSVPAGAYLHALALDADADAVFARLHRNQVQRNIRRAQREGVQVRRAQAERDVSEVFFDLHLRTRRRLGVPVQPKRYFRALWHRVLDAGLGFASIASVDDTPVAAAVFLAFNGTVIYKYGASDARAWTVRANHLLFWDAIEWGCRHGYRTFDWGKTGADDEGLREFKLRWGTTERLLLTTFLGRAPRSSREGLPEGVRRLVRRAPLVVNRALGAVLYRFAA